MQKKELQEQISLLYPFLRKFRRDLHMNPEIGGQEHRTVEKIVQALCSFGFSSKDITTGIAGTGIVATVKGKYPGPVVMYRADMDALRNCTDLCGETYASVNENVCHACGHDVHTTIAVGVAKLLYTCREELHGTAKIFFQPSEELPLIEGQQEEFCCYTERPVGKRAAAAAVEQGILSGKDGNVVRTLAMHCWPSLDVGTIGYEEKIAMAGSGNFYISLLGRSGHAGMPQASVDAIAMAAQAVDVLQTIVSRWSSPSVPLVLNIGTIRGGTRRSTVAGQVELTGTVRCAAIDYLEEFVPREMEHRLKGVCESFGGEYQFEYRMDLPPVCNDEAMLAHDVYVLARMGCQVKKLTDCPMTAEDFSVLSHRIPSVFLKLGTRNRDVKTHYPLHNGHFCVDESCLAVGVEAAAAILLDDLQGLT